MPESHAFLTPTPEPGHKFAGMSVIALANLLLMIHSGIARGDQADSVLPPPSLPDQQSPSLQEQSPNLLIQIPEFVLKPMDAPRDYISGKIVSFAESIDRFFGDDRSYQESNQTLVQLDATRITGYGSTHRFVLSGKAKIHLPTAEKRMHLLLETNPDKNISGEQAQGQSVILNQVDTPESYAAALRYEKDKEVEKPWYFSADAGIQFHGIQTDPFTRARGSYSIVMEPWRLKVAETIYWFNTIGTGESTQIDAERFIGDSLLFRSTSYANWLHEKQNFDLRQDLSIYQTLNERNAMLYQFSMTAISNPEPQVTDFILLILDRYRLHRNWIFLELNPQLHFPKERQYRSSPAISFRLEMLFDGSR